jgi:hypothetical protein
MLGRWCMHTHTHATPKTSFGVALRALFCDVALIMDLLQKFNGSQGRRFRFNSALNEAQTGPSLDLSWTGQRIANAGNDVIPLAFLSRGIVYQHAIHELAGEVATVVPDDVVAEAGNHEEPWRDPLVNNVRGRFFLGQR